LVDVLEGATARRYSTSALVARDGRSAEVVLPLPPGDYTARSAAFDGDLVLRVPADPTSEGPEVSVRSIGVLVVEPSVTAGVRADEVGVAIEVGDRSVTQVTTSRRWISGAPSVLLKQSAERLVVAFPADQTLLVHVHAGGGGLKTASEQVMLAPGGVSRPALRISRKEP
jgi:hypothetical protein